MVLTLPLISKKVNDNSEYRCYDCNKQYSSKSSLCNHNKKFHYNTMKMTLNVTNTDTKTTLNVTSKCYKCKFCNKKFNHRQNKYQHEQKM